jgi:streptogramin lyase
VTARVPLPGSFASPERLSFALGSVWVTSPSTGATVRIDPDTKKSAAPINIPGAYEMAAHDGMLWVAGESGPSVVDPHTNAVVREFATPAVTHVVDMGDSVWAVAPGTGTVYRIDS